MSRVGIHLFLQKSGSWYSCLLWGISLFVLGLADESARSGTYRCEDSAGVTVLTDSPAQLHNCALIFSGVESGQSQPSHESRSPRIPEAPPSLIDQSNGEAADSEIGSERERHAAQKTMNQAAVPIMTMNGSVILSVLLNDMRTARMILDTGATMTVLTTDLAVELALLSGTRNRVTTIQTAGGPVQVTLSRLDSVQVGSAIARHVPVAIHDLPNMGPHIDGLLGMSFLRHFVVTLDIEHNRLYLRPRPDADSSP
ncbi:MAG: hypothetical protein D6690_15440 [Nitrospirae bacterium]|nr:MAG: hypothetical protein D6690_15440 [Nitrospirota bacterium]